MEPTVVAEKKMSLAEAQEEINRLKGIVAKTEFDPRIQELVSEKMAAGLTKDQAVSVARKQVERDDVEAARIAKEKAAKEKA